MFVGSNDMDSPPSMHIAVPWATTMCVEMHSTDWDALTVLVLTSIDTCDVASWKVYINIEWSSTDCVWLHGTNFDEVSRIIDIWPNWTDWSRLPSTHWTWLWNPITMLLSLQILVEGSSKYFNSSFRFFKFILGWWWFQFKDLTRSPKCWIYLFI